MKKILVIIGLVASVLVAPTAANAQAKIVGGPFTDLAASSTIHLAITGFPAQGGLYIQQCLAPTGPTRPANCNSAVQLWISTEMGASFTPTADIIFKPVVSYQSAAGEINCSKVSCGIYVRFDHTKSGDFSEDNFIPLTFKNSSGLPTIPLDVITAFIGASQLSSSKPITLAYQSPGLLRVSSLSGSLLTSSASPTCSVVNGVVTALKGTGACNISVRSPGNKDYSAATANFPIYLTIGQDSIIAKAYPASIKFGQSVQLLKESAFGEDLTFSTKSKYCSVKNNEVKGLLKGSCHIQITGPTRKDLFNGVKTAIKVFVK